MMIWVHNLSIQWDVRLREITAVLSRRSRTVGHLIGYQKASFCSYPDSKDHGAPGGPHVGSMNLAIRVWMPMFVADAMVFLLRKLSWSCIEFRILTSGSMMTSSNGKFSALLGLCAWNSPVTGEFPAQRPVTQSFDVFIDLRLKKRLSKLPWGWWFETS